MECEWVAHICFNWAEKPQEEIGAVVILDGVDVYFLEGGIP